MISTFLTPTYSKFVFSDPRSVEEAINKLMELIREVLDGEEEISDIIRNVFHNSIFGKYAHKP